jgi:hypothetical protein
MRAKIVAMTTVLVTLLAVVIALLAVLLGSLRRRARSAAGGAVAGGALATAVARDRVQRPEAGDVAGTSPDGAPVTVGLVGQPHSLLLVFLSSACTNCAGFWRAFAAGPRPGVPDHARLVAITKGDEAESRERLRRVAPPDITVVMSSAAWNDFGVGTAPWFVHVEGASGRIVADGPAATWDDVVAACAAGTRVR